MYPLTDIYIANVLSFKIYTVCAVITASIQRHVNAYTLCDNLDNYCLQIMHRAFLVTNNVAI